MVDWVSAASAAGAVGLFAVLWFRRAMATQTVAIVCFLLFLVAAVTAANLRSATIVGSPLLEHLAFRPAYLVHPADWWRAYTLVTTMFLHYDVLHIVANMVTLIFIGLPFEERIGRGRWMMVYLGGGVLGTLLHSVYQLQQGTGETFVVGASGAFFAVLAAYATLYPRDPVVLFAIIIIPRAPVYIAAVVYSGMQFFAIFRVPTNVATLAHVGGAIAGVLLAPLVSYTLRRAPVQAAARGVELARLEDLAKTQEQRKLLAKLRENKDEPELAKAWYEKFVASLRCPECGDPCRDEGGVLRCPRGHETDLRG